MTTDSAALDFSRHVSVLPPRTGREPKPFHRAILERRATAHFTSTPVPLEDINAILCAGGQAPSGFNLQPWRFLVLRNLKRRQALRRAAHDQAKITEAPVMIVAFAPHGAWEERARDVLAEGVRRGALPPGDLEQQVQGAVGFVKTLPLAAWLNRHVMIAFTHMMLAAEVLGWDTAPMEGFDPNQVRELLGFPPDTEIVALLAIGQAAGRDRPYPGRLPVSQIAYAEDLAHPWGEPESARPAP